MNSEKSHYFDFINFNDAVLQNSIFYTEKIVDYVFYLNRSDDTEVQNGLYKNAIQEVVEKIGRNMLLKSEILTTLMYNFAQFENIIIIDFIVENLYEKLPLDHQSKNDIQQIQDQGGNIYHLSTKAFHTITLFFLISPNNGTSLVKNKSALAYLTLKTK